MNKSTEMEPKSLLGGYIPPIPPPWIRHWMYIVHYLSLTPFEAFDIDFFPCVTVVESSSVM